MIPPLCIPSPLNFENTQFNRLFDESFPLRMRCAAPGPRVLDAGCRIQDLCRGLKMQDPESRVLSQVMDLDAESRDQSPGSTSWMQDPVHSRTLDPESLIQGSESRVLDP